ncbi:MAG: bifunctional demethylmenaquinone methyltransferase/2-methoxy-6-polyprenyl-1,4-benzoquinol methylase UbiE [Deltaproteobacteria bacterium]|nr:bifunctional demethylmenaquinone methyltransferase/2-methoxy-6-polyprenyl-1,4-benzoquinol methylase UbiE [Deltaproteobacteria bacterium]MBW2208711.1 bifunctional demethylmenaquinone methyltransferase/2-methoxy-6-polyprenyl-1,4-benzoquinol methylase UbiE [Deltaproteobacteria bacterium]
MFWKKSSWIDESEKDDSPKGHLPEGEVTRFGYQKVPSVQKENLVRRHFDTVAKKYDFMNTILSFGTHHLWKRTAIKMTGINPGDQIIDICGGTGDLSILAAGAGAPSSRVILYDINWAMMVRGKPKVEKSIFGENICYVQGDAERISFPDGIFDSALVGFGIRNLTNMEKGFREMYRVLRPGGKLMCLEFSKPTSRVFRRLYDFYSFHIMPLLGWVITGSIKAYTHLPESIRMFPLPNELSAMLEDIGFTEISYRNLTNGIAVIHLAKKRRL